MKTFIYKTPKAELHIYIEGALEPELMFSIAKKNGMVIPFESIAEVRRAYDFSGLKSFLDLYHQGSQMRKCFLTRRHIPGGGSGLRS